MEEEKMCGCEVRSILSEIASQEQRLKDLNGLINSLEKRISPVVINFPENNREECGELELSLPERPTSSLFSQIEQNSIMIGKMCSRISCLTDSIDL